MMNDHCVRLECSVRDMALDSGLPPGADEQIVARVRAMCPGLDGVPVLAVVELTPFSILDGEAVGLVVRFDKVYQGEHFAGYRVGERRVGIRGSAQVMTYWGRYDEGHRRDPRPLAGRGGDRRRLLPAAARKERSRSAASGRDPGRQGGRVDRAARSGHGRRRLAGQDDDVVGGDRDGQALPLP